jgi:steroid 5-alpha reductase family enzyme
VCVVLVASLSRTLTHGNMFSFTNTGHWVALISPAIVALLLIKVSGIPLLEAIADKKYSEDPQYKAYKGRVPVLVPFIGRAGDAAF